MEQPKAVTEADVFAHYPRYRAAARGFRYYWYPVMYSRELTHKPVPFTLLGEKLVLIRDRGKARALHNRCLHRGIPLSEGRQYAPGTLSCPYHGWTYDVETGELVSVLTDRPDSPICGKVSVRTYPVEERLGIIWVYVGDEPAPPVEADIPAELFERDVKILGVRRICKGNWRMAMENGADEGHARFLHRTGLWQFFREPIAWSEFHERLSDDPTPWLIRVRDRLVWEDTYPRVGKWPPKRPWHRCGKSVQLSSRLPCIERSLQDTGLNCYSWWVPIDENHYMQLMNFVQRVRGPMAVVYWLWFHLYARWARFGLFIGQDQWMIERIEIPPERLYGPDKSITAWRKYCEEYARDGGAIRPTVTAD